MRKVLTPSFFDRPVLEVAPELLGKFLIVHGHAYMIHEVEAYDGEEDLASHASKGLTPRTQVMYGEAGIWYVYLIYGMYDMLNIVCGPKGYPSAILIRGVEGFSGPGKLTKNIGITRTYNNTLATHKTGLWIEDRGYKIADNQVEVTPRIGVAYAQEWAHKPYRFVLNKK